MYDSILETIKSYITEENTDYAILLDGDWGTGKTFFIENILKKDDLCKDNQIISISAAGVNDVDSFINNIYLRIALEKSSLDRKKIEPYKSLIKCINFISNKLSININIFGLSIISNPILKSLNDFIVKKKSDFSNILFIIDDIERISDSIDIEEFLYKIHDIFILKGLKVLFVGNENEIKYNKERYESSNSKREEQSKYFKIKEKVIRHTIHIYGIDISIFKSIIEDIFKKIENNKYEFYKRCLFDSHIYELIKIFFDKNCFNIRIFLTYLDLSKRLFDIKELKEDNKLFEKILLKLLSILIEIRSYNKYDNNLYKMSEIYKNNNDNDKDYILINTIRKYIETGHLEKENIINYYKENIRNNYN